MSYLRKSSYVSLALHDVRHRTWLAISTSAEAFSNTQRLQVLKHSSRQCDILQWISSIDIPDRCIIDYIHLLVLQRKIKNTIDLKELYICSLCPEKMDHLVNIIRENFKSIISLTDDSSRDTRKIQTPSDNAEVGQYIHIEDILESLEVNI